MARFSKTAVAKLSQGGDAGIHWDDDLGGFGLRIYPSGVAAYIIDYRSRGRAPSAASSSGKSPRSVSRRPGSGRRRRWRRPAEESTSTRNRGRKSPGTRMRSGGKPTARPCAKPSRLTLRRSNPRRRNAEGGDPRHHPSVRPIGGSAGSLRCTASRARRPDRTQVQAVLDATPQSSRRNVYGAIRRLMDWARRQSLTTTSPIGPIDPPARPASRDRTPSPTEVAAILAAADALLASGRWRQVQRDGVWLLALTAQRRAEVASMAWEDLDLGSAEWRQPGVKNKTGKPHVVPLGRASLELLLLRWEAAGRPSEGLVLRGVRGGGRMDANLSDLQGLLREVTGIAFRLHDFRRSAVSAMAEHGVDFAVADSILNHAASQSRGGMMAVYQHAELKGAKRRAVEIWEGALFPRSAEVIALRPR